MYNMATIVNNIVLYILNLLTEILSAVTTKFFKKRQLCKVMDVLN